MKAGKVSVRDPERDKEMVADYLRLKATGKPFTAKMVGKYKISMTRIYDVLRNNGVEFSKRKAKK